MRSILIALAGLLAGAAFAVGAHAEVTIEQPWVRASVPGQQATGAFMQLTSSHPGKLVAADTPVAANTEIHEMAMVDDVMKMREIDSLDLPAGRMVELAPGGYHLMLIQLHEQLKEGDEVPLTLTFEAADGKRTQVAVHAAVRSLTAAAGHGAAKSHHGVSHAHHHDHGGHVEARHYPDPAGVAAPEGVSIQDCWIRALPGNLPSAAYFVLKNDSDRSQTLLDVLSPDHAKTMLHATKTDGGMTSMAAAGEVAIPAKQTLAFAPGGYHVMLEESKRALRVGDIVSLVFWFKADQAITAPCVVKPANTLG